MINFPMKFRPALLIHPFLFAVYPILFLYSHNIDQVLFKETLLPAAIVLFFTFALLLLLRSVLGNWKKAGIVVSVFWATFFSFGVVESIAGDYGDSRLAIFILLLFLMIVLPIATFIWILSRIGKPLIEKGTQVFNIVSVALVLMPLFLMTANMWEVRGNVEGDKPALSIPVKRKQELPDIYYIILDAYGSSNTLKNLYGYSNHDFTGFLESKGFFIAGASRSNYPWTHQSLASSLNMQYIHAPSSTDEESNYNLYQMILKNKAARFLKSRGYKVIDIGSGSFNVARHNRYADLSFNKIKFAEFWIMLSKTTPLYPLVLRMSFDDHRNSVLHALGKLEEVSDIKGPKFTFAHLLIPHNPFVFKSNGDRIPADESFWASIWSRSEDNILKRKNFYVGQLIFVNKKIREWANQTISKSRIPPIIVIQGDHGPLPHYRGIFNYKKIGEEDNRKLHREILRERMEILNAFYFPGGGEGVLYKTITPVNTFRLIFNYYFGTNYELLPDESFAYNYAGFGKEKFVNVTNKVNRN